MTDNDNDATTPERDTNEDHACPVSKLVCMQDPERGETVCSLRVEEGKFRYKKVFKLPGIFSEEEVSVTLVKGGDEFCATLYRSAPEGTPGERLGIITLPLTHPVVGLGRLYFHNGGEARMALRRESGSVWIVQATDRHPDSKRPSLRMSLVAEAAWLEWVADAKTCNVMVQREDRMVDWLGLA